MPHPALAAWLLAAVLSVMGPLISPLERRVFRSDPGTPRKLRAYAAIAGVSWLLAGVAVWTIGWRPLLDSPGPTAAWLPAAAVVAPAVAALLVGFALLLLAPLIQSLRGPRWRRAYAAAMRRSFAALPGLLPNTAAERVGFALVSLTAGVCEEVLFRGFLIRFLHESALGLPLIGALAVSSLLFGLGHSYQGFKRVLGTALVGAGFAVLYLLSGSLAPCIVLHVLADLQVAYVLRPAPEDAPVVPEAA